jgi:serine/threonine-protein kinase HipA
MNLNKIKKLLVSTPQGESGFLNKEAQFSFGYTSPLRETEISIAMPFQAASYNHGALFSIFLMNKPEGYLLDSLRSRFGKISPLDDMALLKITGQHQIGRLTFSDPLEKLESLNPSVGLDELLKSNASEDLFNYLVDKYFNSGISGFQPKVLVADKDNKSPVIDKATAITPDLIVKSAGEDYPHLAENEFMCMSVAKEAGFDVPNFWLSDDNGLFIIERFDIDNHKGRLGLEDMCSITNKPSEEKYHGSYEGIAKIISTLCTSDTNKNLSRYFESIALSVLLKNGDAHLKNFSLIYEHPGADINLSQIYDVVTTSVYSSTNPRTGMNIVDRTLALNMNKSKSYPSDTELCNFGKSVCQLSNPREVLDRIEDAKQKVISESIHRVDSSFLKNMAECWGIEYPKKTAKPR